MPNRIAGIDVHKRMLAIVVADAAAEGEFQFERRQFFQQSRPTAELGRLADRAGSPGSGHGIDGAVLEAGMESAGT